MEIKSKIGPEFRHLSVEISETINFEEFTKHLQEHLDNLHTIPFLVFYINPSDHELLPIDNDDDLRRALFNGNRFLRIIIIRNAHEDHSGYGTLMFHNLMSKILRYCTFVRSKPSPISDPQVLSIIDMSIVPKTFRQVRLLKRGSDTPLGFYIEHGTSWKITKNGLEKIPGIFISRLVPGGLAESTGLLAVDDEILAVNGIKVTGKTLDEVICMIVANNSDLMITIKPANQETSEPCTSSKATRWFSRSRGSIRSR